MFPVLCWLEHLGGQVKILDKDLILVELHSFPHLQNFLLQAMSLNCFLHFFVCPSYDRICAQYVESDIRCWGKENREAPLRTACPPGVPNGVVSNFEIKAFDGCSNPHLGLAAIIAAGIDGLRRHLSLSEPIGSLRDCYVLSSSDLQHLVNLRWNKLQDVIPPEIGELKSLTHLYLSFNNFKGEIPKELANLPLLRYLYLHENPCFHCRYLDHNQFTGRIPDAFYKHTFLKEMYIEGNAFRPGVNPIGIHNVLEVSDIEFLF
ncbi:LRR receptor-like serine/threonine-protein kinase FLS2 [Camellia lanceoleosa]|uniref:LRR receptor-like serine/threonine-protein kinase FLS2 n=1 Tax=Camellia lanceoleosa TaxID=1840588 RepID=A0ACC0IP33_9ERIC|nr:LRR receptor-like serine/threonine-protein kinase FLS2 [Camellia lanceoleosa]